jgi:hypothetical protein
MEPAIRRGWLAVATTPIFYTPAGFGAYMAAEVEKWGKAIRAAHITPD